MKNVSLNWTYKAIFVIIVFVEFLSYYWCSHCCARSRWTLCRLFLFFWYPRNLSYIKPLDDRLHFNFFHMESVHMFSLLVHISWRLEVCTAVLKLTCSLSWALYIIVHQWIVWYFLCLLQVQVQIPYTFLFFSCHSKVVLCFQKYKMNLMYC